MLTGPVADQAHLVGIIDRTQELGLELISVGPFDEAPGSPAGQGVIGPPPVSPHSSGPDG